MKVRTLVLVSRLRFLIETIVYLPRHARDKYEENSCLKKTCRVSLRFRFVAVLLVQQASSRGRWGPALLTVRHGRKLLSCSLMYPPQPTPILSRQVRNKTVAVFFFHVWLSISRQLKKERTLNLPRQARDKPEKL